MLTGSPSFASFFFLIAGGNVKNKSRHSSGAASSSSGGKRSASGVKREHGVKSEVRSRVAYRRGLKTSARFIDSCEDYYYRLDVSF